MNIEMIYTIGIAALFGFFIGVSLTVLFVIVPKKITISGYQPIHGPEDPEPDPPRGGSGASPIAKPKNLETFPSYADAGIKIDHIRDGAIKIVDTVFGSDWCKRLELQGKTPSLNSRLTEDLGADSLDKVEMIVEAETRFRITITDEQAARIRTIADFIREIRVSNNSEIAQKAF